MRWTILVALASACLLSLPASGGEPKPRVPFETSFARPASEFNAIAVVRKGGEQWTEHVAVGVISSRVLVAEIATRRVLGQVKRIREGWKVALAVSRATGGTTAAWLLSPKGLAKPLSVPVAAPPSPPVAKRTVSISSLGELPALVVSYGPSKVLFSADPQWELLPLRYSNGREWSSEPKPLRVAVGDVELSCVRLRFSDGVEVVATRNKAVAAAFPIGLRPRTTWGLVRWSSANLEWRLKSIEKKPRLTQDWNSRLKGEGTR